MNARRYLGVLIVLAGLNCIQFSAAKPRDAFEAEARPIEPGQITRDRARRQTKANQENNRIWVAIPHAVTDEVERAPSAVITPPPPPPAPSIFDGKKDQIRIGFALALVIALVVRVLIRHREEAEIRALSGGYLSDGTEVARFKMPELFTPAPVSPSPSKSKAFASAAASRPEEPEFDPSGEFFKEAPTQLGKLREMLKELGENAEAHERQTIFTGLHEIVCDLKRRSEHWTLRPAWQMSAALELLLKRIIDKPKDSTPSIIRTITSGVEVLSEVCVPGIRPDLLTEPPIKILAVDDDQLCRRAVHYALEKAHLTPDLAEDGEQAVALATNTMYDVVFMDIMMPKVDGFAACSRIHQIEKNATVPVIFVTALSDFDTRAKSSVAGGCDLIAKPYLVLELTVKAVTFAMRGRLRPSWDARREAATSKPAASAEVLNLTAESHAAISPGKSGSSKSADLTNFVADAPEYLAATRAIIGELRAGLDTPALQDKLESLYLRVHALAAKAALSNLHHAARLGSNLEALLNKLYGDSKTITTSTLNTIDNALKLLGSLCARDIEAKLAGQSPVKILVVDDEPLARRAVAGALQLAFEKPDSAENGAAGCVLAAQKAYDVIFTDVEMPLMDGFAVCKDVRNGKTNRETPVIFVTSHADAATQTRAMESGANDFIAKPFLPIEITVKALTFAWENRLQKPDKVETSSAPPASTSALPQVEAVAAAG